MNNITMIRKCDRSIRDMVVGERAIAADGREILRVRDYAVHLDTGEYVVNMDCLIRSKAVSLCDLRVGQFGLCGDAVILKTNYGGVNVATGQRTADMIDVEIIESFRVN